MKFTESISFDKVLYKYNIMGSPISIQYYIYLEIPALRHNIIGIPISIQYYIYLEIPISKHDSILFVLFFYLSRIPIITIIIRGEIFEENVTKIVCEIY